LRGGAAFAALTVVEPSAEVTSASNSNRLRLRDQNELCDQKARTWRWRVITSQ
jgi:hypothetical protein